MIITLCGSARFEDEFIKMNKRLSLLGHCVFSLAVFPSTEQAGKNWYTDDEKYILDAVHKAKILTSDAIVILNKYAYVGESTLKEIEFAKRHNKKCYVLESWGKGIEGFGSPIDTTTNNGFEVYWNIREVI